MTIAQAEAATGLTTGQHRALAVIRDLYGRVRIGGQTRRQSHMVWDKAIAALDERGLITGPHDGQYQLTEAGLDALDVWEAHR